MYQGFAELYDELMDDVNYEGWADHYTRLLSIYGIRSGKVCECLVRSIIVHISNSTRNFWIKP